MDELSIQKVVTIFQDLVKNSDHRAMTYPFMSSPKYILGAVGLYLVMVIYGPRLMEDRKPFSLRRVLIGYNCFAVLLSFWMMWEFLACSFLNPEFKYFCEDITESDTSPISTRMMNVSWLYFVSKIIEFADTVRRHDKILSRDKETDIIWKAFFVLRKKTNQISFLHVYHHASMATLQWVVFQYVPVGASYFGSMLNCFIHVLMYGYYLLSAFGPHMQKYLWWKKYLTTLQMVQFVLIITNSFICWKFCNYSPTRYTTFFLTIHSSYLISLFWLFHRFYRKSYTPTLKQTYTNGKTE